MNSVCSGDGQSGPERGDCELFGGKSHYKESGLVEHLTGIFWRNDRILHSEEREDIAKAGEVSSPAS